MDKKIFEMYEAPALKVVELKIKSQILDASAGGFDDNSDGEGSEDDD